ncbi:MAG: ATP-binding protein [Phycisphaerae bacterium]
MVISSDLYEARQVEQRILEDIERLGYSEADVFAIKLALEEALNNAVRHGNRLDATKTVEVRFDADEAEARICIRDEGPGFRPADVPDPTADENLEKPSGRGIMLMRAYMDVVEFNESGNEVRMVKRKE